MVHTTFNQYGFYEMFHEYGNYMQGEFNFDIYKIVLEIFYTREAPYFTSSYQINALGIKILL